LPPPPPTHPAANTTVQANKRTWNPGPAAAYARLRPTVTRNGPAHFAVATILGGIVIGAVGAGLYALVPSQTSCPPEAFRDNTGGPGVEVRRFRIPPSAARLIDPIQ
jgi:hypothetical protein